MGPQGTFKVVFAGTGKIVLPLLQTALELLPHNTFHAKSQLYSSVLAGNVKQMKVSFCLQKLV